MFITDALRTGVGGSRHQVRWLDTCPGKAHVSSRPALPWGLLVDNSLAFEPFVCLRMPSSSMLRACQRPAAASKRSTSALHLRLRNVLRFTQWFYLPRPSPPPPQVSDLSSSALAAPSPRGSPHASVQNVSQSVTTTHPSRELMDHTHSTVILFRVR